MKNRNIGLLLLVALVIMILPGCALDDPIPGDIYSQNIYPGADSTYAIGSSSLAFSVGYFDAIFIGGVPAGGGSGDVVGPAGATSNALVRYDGVTGKLIKDSLGTTLDDFANLTLGGDLFASDINAGNDVNVTNDLDVTDNADIGGDLDVTGTTTFNDQLGLAGSGLAWIELRPDLDATKIAAATKPTTVTRGIALGYSLPVGGASEELYYNICVPNRWDESFNIILHIDAWLDTAQNHALDAVELTLNWQQVGEGDAVPVGSNPVLDEVVTGIVPQFTAIEFEFIIDYDVVPADAIQDDDTIFFHLVRSASSQEIDGEPVIYHAGVIFRCDKLGNPSP